MKNLSRLKNVLLLSIKKFGINKYWNYYFNKFVTQNPKNETDLLNKLTKSKKISGSN